MSYLKEQEPIDILGGGDEHEYTAAMNDIFLAAQSAYFRGLEEKDALMHYGTPRHSGRYPWGSGGNPYQHEDGYPFNTSKDFISAFDEALKNGTSEKEFADSLGLSLRELRTYAKVARSDRKSEQQNTIRTLSAQGINNSEIARKMGVSEGTVRNALKIDTDEKKLAARETADFLKSQIDEKGMIDVGKGVELDINRTRANVDDAILLLKAEGYPVYQRRLNQVTNPNQSTTFMIACPPGTEYREVYNNDNISSIKDYTADPNVDGGFRKIQYPKSLDSKRLMINYAEDGGKNKDGVIEIRRGVKDLDLGPGVHYAQTRILVDDSHYLKGMAVYADDLPDGIDIRFNTNKSKDVPMLGTKDNSVLKPKKSDPINPFGATIDPKGQSTYVDDDGETKLSLINKTRSEGSWDEWNNELPSQFLAKQNITLINRQLDISMKEKQAEYDEICSLDNPTVKKQLLETFANDCDSAAVHLKAAALPRQRYQVILPVVDIKDDEVYAPNFEDGEKVALVRFPYAGYFESPLLTVNNKNKEGKRVIGENALDAVGISANTAAQLSGADFDGDTVLVIPTGKNKAAEVRTGKPLKGLEGFETTGGRYKKVEGMQMLGKEQQQNEMGRVSNLIMDMTIKGASEEELTRAVKHSMVIIDAEKHELNYKLSEKDNDIPGLIDKYKGHETEDGKYSTAASTLLTKAASETSVAKTRGSALVNIEGKSWYDPSKPEGSLIYKTALDKDRFWTDEKGKVHERTKKSTQMADTDDPYKLVSEYESPVELAYAKYASFNKNLANTARKEMVTTGKIEYSKEAAKEYSEEVSSLKSKLNDAKKNSPRERMAQLKASSEISRRMDNYKEDHPEAKKSELGKERKKYSQQAIESARNEYGAKGAHIDFTDKEWEAAQKGAIHETTLKELLKYSDIDKVRQKATPKQTQALTQGQQNRIEALNSRGLTNAQIADKLGVSTATVIKYLKGES